MIQKRNSTFLMANLGSEVARLLQARAEKNQERMKGASNRARLIFDEIMTLPDIKSRKKEIELVWEVIEDLQSETPRFSVSTDLLRNYFMPFALKAMSV
jgi:hypothetical protein